MYIRRFTIQRRCVIEVHILYTDNTISLTLPKQLDGNSVDAIIVEVLLLGYNR
jgi:hypothetical protein